MKYRVLIEQDEDGAYVAGVPTLPGCISQGQTREKAVESVWKLSQRTWKAWRRTTPHSAPDHRRVGRGPRVSILPRVSGREVVKALQEIGYERDSNVAATSFSDRQCRRTDGSPCPTTRRWLKVR